VMHWRLVAVSDPRIWLRTAGEPELAPQKPVRTVAINDERSRAILRSLQIRQSLIRAPILRRPIARPALAVLQSLERALAAGDFRWPAAGCLGSRPCLARSGPVAVVRQFAWSGPPASTTSPGWPPAALARSVF